ncbi:MAG: hypothetical protein ABJE47_09010 [bacterium]
MRLHAFALGLSLTVATAPLASGQSLPFLFIEGATPLDRPRVSFLYDAALGDRSLQSMTDNGFLQRVTAAVRMAPEFTAIAHVETTPSLGRPQYSERVELQWQPGALSRLWSTPVAFSVGARREFQGADVLLAGLSGAHVFGGGLAALQVRAEHSLQQGRDPIDLITSAGWMQRLSDAGQIGIEATGQDVEGFWSADEAEGGATLFVGPTVAFSPPAARWSLVLGAGPVLRATHSLRSSGAPRDISIDTQGGYMIRTSFRMSIGR